MIEKITDRILSFDPGFTTGIAFLENGQLEIGMVVSDKVFLQESFLLGLMKMTRPTMIVIEKPPQAARFNVQRHADLFNYLVKWFTVAGYRVKILIPGQWKGMVKRTSVESSHIRDAADMGKFVISLLERER